MDGRYDSEMKKLANWLLFGLSGADIASKPQGFYNDSFFVVSKNAL